MQHVKYIYVYIASGASAIARIFWCFYHLVFVGGKANRVAGRRDRCIFHEGDNTFEHHTLWGKGWICSSSVQENATHAKHCAHKTVLSRGFLLHSLGTSSRAILLALCRNTHWHALCSSVYYIMRVLFCVQCCYVGLPMLLVAQCIYISRRGWLIYTAFFGRYLTSACG